MSQPVASTQPPVDTRQAQLKKLQSLLRDVFSAQQFLIEVKQLRKEQWELISMYLQKKEYLEVVEERSCNHKCGFCFCNNPTSTIEEQRLERWAKSRGEEPKQPSLLDPRPPDNLELLEFSRTKGDFVDSSEKLYYCSNSCFVESKLLIESLDVLPLNLRKIPWSDFNECLRAMNTAKTDAIEREQRGEAPDVVMLDANPVNKRELHTVKEELAAVKADHSNIKITENERVAEPSDDFQIQDGIPLPMKPRKMQLPFFSATQSFLADLITDKTKEFLTTLKTQETSVTEEDLNSYSFQPLSATFKRYKALENTVTKEFATLQACFRLDKEILTFISTMLRTMRYSNPVKTGRKSSLVVTLVFIFVACRYNPNWQAKLDENLVPIKRLLRIDCELTRGKFEVFLSNFDIK